MSLQTVGFDIGHQSTVVVYDRRSGEIVHVHQVVCERGIRRPGRARLERDAREQAADTLRARRLTARQVALLHADGQKFEPSSTRTYKVDLARRRLRRITVRPPRRRRIVGGG